MYKLRTIVVEREGKKYRLKCPICEGTTFYLLDTMVLFCAGCTEHLSKAAKPMKSRHSKTVSFRDKHKVPEMCDKCKIPLKRQSKGCYICPKCGRELVFWPYGCS